MRWASRPAEPDPPGATNSPRSIRMSRPDRSQAAFCLPAVLTHRVKILFAYDLAIANPIQPDFIQLETLAGGLVGHIILKPNNKPVVMRPGAGNVRRVDLVVVGPPGTFRSPRCDALRLTLAARRGTGLDADNVLAVERIACLGILALTA